MDNISSIGGDFVSAIDRRLHTLACTLQAIAHPLHTPPRSIPKGFARNISKRKSNKANAILI